MMLSQNRKMPVKNLLIAFFIIISPSTSFADHEFTYENVFACGPRILETIPKGMEGMGYFLIHDNEQGDKFSIYEKEYEYSSFKKIHYTDLYVQRGGERWLTFQKISDSIIRFELHNLQKEYGKYLSVLTFDVVGMSAVLKESWREETKLLVCWKYN